jgi:D-3-phosphoglycerate dehydrogenase
MPSIEKVAVCSRSFSRNKVLREELLAEFPNTTFNDDGKSLSGADLVEFLSGHQKAIVALETIDQNIIEQLPELSRFAKYGVGLDMIDLEALKNSGKELGWEGGVNRRSVSELVISNAISLLRKIPQASAEVRSGTWRQHIGGLLTGRTVGIIGCGFIGKDLIHLLKPWGCQILANDILDFDDFYAEHQVRAVSLEELMASSDVVTVHTPLNASTENFVNKTMLNRLQSHAILINAARGGLVDEEHLEIMLREGQIAGAAFDVFAQEPPQKSELLNLPNFLATPHIGGSAEEVVLEMGRSAIRSLSANDVF